VIKAISLWLVIFLGYRILLVLGPGLGSVNVFSVTLAISADFGWAIIFAYFAWHRFLQLAITLFLLTALGFARLYERPFMWSYIRTDSFSIWKENFISAFYELGWPQAAFTIFVILVLAFSSRPKQPLRWSIIFLAIVVLGAGMFLQGAPSLVHNPVSAAFAVKKTQAKIADELRSDNVIPSSEAIEDLPPLLPVSVERKKRSVLIYFFESTPANVIGKKVQGKEITPNLNKLREKSLSFDRHYANFPLSINAFYNAFCGTYALPDGAWISMVLPDFQVQCLSQIFKKEGYRTIALHAGYLGYAKQKRFMQNRSFDFMADAETIKKQPYAKGMGPWGAADERAMIAPLASFIAESSAPYLATLFAFAPHHPYNKPDDFKNLISHDESLKSSQVRYINSLHFADYAFGEIMSSLEVKGLLKNTLVIVLGDHGEAFYEHKSNFNHPFFIYEENIHVPLLMWYEGVKPQRVTRVTSHVDILPTVLDVSLLKKHHSALHVGRSMLRGGPASVAHIQAYWQEEFSGIVGPRFKYIRRENGFEELFDLTKDASEKLNLAVENVDTLKTYRNLTQRAFLEKAAYYKKYAGYELTRFKPLSQDR